MPDTSAQQPCEAPANGSRPVHNLSKKTCSRRSRACNTRFPGYSRELIFFTLFSDNSPHWGVYFCDKFQKMFVKIFVLKNPFSEKEEKQNNRDLFSPLLDTCLHIHIPQLKHFWVWGFPFRQWLIIEYFGPTLVSNSELCFWLRAFSIMCEVAVLNSKSPNSIRSHKLQPRTCTLLFKDPF